jgi:hypothetical protein
MHGCGKVAKQKPKKPDSTARLNLTVKAGHAQRLRVAAAHYGISESALIEQFIDVLLPGVHARGCPETIGQPAGQGSGSPPPSVAIPNGIKSTMNRIGKIAESSTAPVDEAIDSFQTESELITDHGQN